MIPQWTALLLTIVAGVTTILGGLLSLLLGRKMTATQFAGALGFAAGVMIFVSFVEIYFEAQEHLNEAFDVENKHNGKAYATMAGMILFFCGWFAASILDGTLHMMLEWKSTPDSQRELPMTKPDVISEVKAKAVKEAKFEATETESRGCWRRIVDNRFFKAIAGTEELSPVLEAFINERFTHDCHRVTRLGYFTALALTLHNFPEGIATFTGATADLKLGVYLAIAIGIHNIPEGIAVGVPILCGTGSRTKAMVFTSLSALAEPLGGLFAWWLLGKEPNHMMFGVLLFLVCGVMVNVALKELAFSALRYDLGNRITSISIASGMILMAISLVALEFSMPE